MEGLRRIVGRVGKMRMCCSQVARKFIEFIVSMKNTWGHIDYTIVSIELLDSGASLRGITLSENLVEVTEEQFVNSFGHGFPFLLRVMSFYTFSFERIQRLCDPDSARRGPGVGIQQWFVDLDTWNLWSDPAVLRLA